MELMSKEFYQKVNAVWDKYFDKGVISKRTKTNRNKWKQSYYLYTSWIDKPYKYVASEPCEVVVFTGPRDLDGSLPTYICFYYQPEDIHELHSLIYEGVFDSNDRYIIVYDGSLLDTSVRDWVKSHYAYFASRMVHIFDSLEKLDEFLATNEWVKIPGWQSVLSKRVNEEFSWDKESVQNNEETIPF